MSTGFLLGFKNFMEDVYSDKISKGDILALLFNEYENKAETTGQYTYYFNADVFPPSCAAHLNENNSLVLSKLIDYYEQNLFKLFKTKGNNIFVMWFLFLENTIQTYIDTDSRNKLINFANTKRVKRNEALMLRNTDPAKQLLRYYQNVVESGNAELCTPDTFACSLFSFLFYIENGYLPKTYSEQLNGINKDRQEFIDTVLTKYGCTGKPGKFIIYKLANREDPNSIALYEAAELEYYGNGCSSEPNFQKAYEYYYKAISSSNFNPLAAWSLGFVLYNYKNPKDALSSSTIIEIENLTEEERIFKAMEYSTKSFNRGCPAAANVIGKIFKDEKISNSVKEELVRRYQLDPRFYEDPNICFKIAADSGYVYAKNNLAEYYSSIAEDGDENFELAYKYLKESADLGEPYAMNRYAYFYLLDYKKDKVGALKYFYEAALLGEKWAAINILIHYCSSDKGVKLIKELPAINGNEQKYYLFIKQLKHICTVSNDIKVTNLFNEWKEKYNSIYGRNYQQY